MALFNKLFSTNKKRNTSQSSQKSSSGQFPFAADQVRVVLFRECDIRGRKLLFDSSAVEKIPDAPSSSSFSTSSGSATGCGSTNYKTMPQTQKCDHCKALFQHSSNPKNDIKPLAEMIFGSAPIAFQGSSLKVHWLKAPAVMMCSHVFPAPVSKNASGTSSKKISISSYLGSDLGVGSHCGFNPERYPSGSDLSSIDTTSLRSFTVTSSTSTQHDMSYNHRHRLPIPPEFGQLERLTDPRLSTNSGMDSGYGGTDPWACSASSSRHPLSSSHRSSLASISSDFECFRRLSTDTNVDLVPAVSVSDCSQYGSFNRRVSKNLSTSFENRLSLADHVGHVDDLSQTGSTCASSQVTASDGCVGRQNRRNSETMELNRRKAFSGEVLSTSTNYQGKPPSKKARLGLALYIQLDDGMQHEMEAYCSEHMSIFEWMLCRLRVAAENACHRWPLFLQIMLTAWHSTQQWLLDFFTAPRLVNPVWLTLSSSACSAPGSSSSQQNQGALSVANNFMNDLSSLLSLADTKDTKLFISTLLTAVLTHHLGWVSTIAPMNGSSSAESLPGSADEKDKISKLTANHPYNVLWAQLGDLYGAVGYPVKLTKTIICGSPQLSNTIGKILNVLSYFVRCSEIRRTAHMEVFDEGKVKEAFSAQRVINTGGSSQSFQSGLGVTSDCKSPKLPRTASGMVRSATRMKDLTAMGKDMGDGTDGELSNLLKKTVMNDIPNVLVYRDSRFVQQELRIGNKSMDTELLMNAREKQFLEMIYHIKKEQNRPPIRMTLTQPDETAQEAIELDVNDTGDTDSIRLSKLITENSIGDTVNGQRFLWGLERIKEGISLEQLKYIDVLRGDFDALKQSRLKDEVVFVLGENEQLVNIKQPQHSTAVDRTSELGAVGGKKPCSHSKIRKHSFIFNFDQYPKVVENYLKSQNLELSEHEFLEKGVKWSLKFHPEADFSSSTDPSEEEECDICRNTSLLYLQTPTNASELEFSSDLNESSSHDHASSSFALATVQENVEIKAKHPDSILKLVDIPISKPLNVTNANDENNNDKTDKLRKLPSKAGFIPSLFSRVADHYIPDMILQGTTAPPPKWERALKKDLSLASRFSLMEQYPTENLAIVANLETHDVRLITSNQSSLAPSNPNGELVGMSQIVSSMLETVHAMWSSGLSSFQCMAFIESKLRELYLQSESIASFLLATDFCSIESITKALNITANDMPLLMSVASIHSPEVTKRYVLQYR